MLTGEVDEWVNERGREKERELTSKRENRVHAFSPIVICSIMHIYIKIYASCRIRKFGANE
jgi:hypothetical protein